MARRNPLEEMKKKYFRGLKIREFHPWSFYYSCIKCGDEFCREKMYECKEHNIFFTYSNYYRGCTHCFNSKDEFRKYLEDEGKILKEGDLKYYMILKNAIKKWRRNRRIW